MNSNKQDSKLIAYNYIKKMIVTCVMSPGSTIQINDIAAELNISKTPVREALLELSYENYVIISPRKSTTVAKISLQELKDIYDARSVIESYIITNLDTELTSNREALSRLKSQWEKISSDSQERESFVAFLDADVHFHLTITRLCSNNQLVKFCEELILKSQRFWYMALFNNNMNTVRAEHLELLENLLSGNRVAAVAVAEKHISISKALSILSE